MRYTLALLRCWTCHFIFQEMEKIAIELEEKRKEDEEKEKQRKQVKWTALNLRWILTYFLISCILLWPFAAGDGKTETPRRRENQGTEWREEEARKVRNVTFLQGQNLEAASLFSPVTNCIPWEPLFYFLKFSFKPNFVWQPCLWTVTAWPRFMLSCNLVTLRKVCWPKFCGKSSSVGNSSLC